MIGIIDSGSGGLSVLQALLKELPSAEYLYFGDIKNAPYGEKSHAELSRLTINALKFLKDNEVTKVVSACNSVSASMAISLFDTLLTSQRIIEMVGPTVAAFVRDERRIAVCATQATIASGMYQNGFLMATGKEIITIPIPDLAGQIEFGADQETLIRTIVDALTPHLGTFDVLILGCTHYPLVRDLFSEVAGSEFVLYDPAEAVAERARTLFGDEKNDIDTSQIRFVISKESSSFRTYAETLFAEHAYSIEVAP